MAIREKIVEKAAPFLEPGEQVQAVIGAQTASQFLFLLGALPFILSNRYRCVLATDRRILVLDSGRRSAAAPKAVTRVLPRATRIGPPSGAIWFVTGSLGETLRIHKRFFKDIEAADAAAGAAAGTPPPPPPPPA